MNDVSVKFWYEEVIQDIDKVIDAIEYYKKIYQNGLSHTKMKGVLHRLMEEQPGLMRIYEDALTDASMVHKWMDETIRFMKAQKRIELMKDAELKQQYGGDLKKTDIDQFIIADEDIRYHIQLQLMIELWRNMLHNLVERLNKRSIYLTMISKLRIAGQHEAFIDTTHETNPETLR